MLHMMRNSIILGLNAKNEPYGLFSENLKDEFCYADWDNLFGFASEAFTEVYPGFLNAGVFHTIKSKLCPSIPKVEPRELEELVLGERTYRSKILKFGDIISMHDPEEREPLFHQPILFMSAVADIDYVEMLSEVIKTDGLITQILTVGTKMIEYDGDEPFIWDHSYLFLKPNDVKKEDR